MNGIFCPSVAPFYAFRRRRHYVFGLSVRPKPEIPSFDLYMGPLVHPTNRDRFTACPSVRLSVWIGFRAFGAHHQGEIREIMENVKKISLIWKNHGIPFPGKNHGKVVEIRIPEKKICFDLHFNACITI